MGVRVYMKKEVLIIFKTHLDIGYTDFSANIIGKYINEYIPNAIRVGNELKNTDTPFVWTVGSWLVNEALKYDKDGSVEKAVNEGILNWHALPFTTHTELMSKELFEYGMDISKKLDTRFGRKTIAAKMTDVPGHTIAICPILQERGIGFLHIGVNPATPLPPVPPIFKWKLRNSEITVMYQGDYGQVEDFGDFVVYFAHTNDNMGPQSADEIKEIYEKIRAEYPDCILKAATLNDVAERVANLKNLPVVENEIGDTWIHGAATDPQKLSRYKRLLRYINDNNIQADFTDNLLLVPEHTWGMCVQKYFPDTEHFTYEEIEKISGNTIIEKSWTEQRKYVEDTEEMLGIEKDYDTSKPDLSLWTEIDVKDNTGFEICWQIFDNSDYARYKETYMRSYVEWAIWDFTKVGLPDYDGGVYSAKVKKAYKCGDDTLLRLEFDEDITIKFGLPYFYVKLSKDNVEIKWFDKKASRLPQACWFKIKGLDEKWELCKMGEWIKADSIIGSPLISACEKIRNGNTEIELIDSALVAPFGKKLLHYNEKDLCQDLHFILYDNIWNTNFPIWYSDDAIFRFKIKDQK